MIVNSSDSIAQHDVFGPIVKKSTSNLADSIAQLDVFEENGSKKGSKWLDGGGVIPITSDFSALKVNLLVRKVHFPLVLQ